MVKQEIKFQEYKESLENNKTILKSPQRFRSEAHSVFTEKVNKVSLSANYDKRIKTSDGVTTYPRTYECEVESLSNSKIKL